MISPPAARDPQPGKDAATHPRVVICEDSSLMRQYVALGLSEFGVRAEEAASGVELDRMIAHELPDIVILDIGLPGEDGYSIAERLRREHPRVGIIMLTARDQVDDRVRGLDCGADLYFAKPVDLRELASAVGSLHRRLRSLHPAGGDNWRLEVRRSSLVTPAGIAIDLTDNELRFLVPLFEHSGDVVERDDLLRALDQRPDVYAMRRLDTLVSRLRSKVQRASPEEPLPVRARHGRGYALLCEAEI